MQHSYNQIIKLLTLFAEAHPQVKSNDSGFLADLNSFLKNNLDLPCLYFEVTSIANNSNTQDFNFNVYSLDARQKNNGNQRDVLSDTAQTLTDLRKWLISNFENDQIWSIQFTQDIFTPYNNYTNDWLTGWSMGITISSALIESDCDAPLNQIDWPNISPIMYNFLTCESLVNCLNFSNLVDRVDTIDQQIIVIDETLISLQDQIDNLPAGFSCSDLPGCQTIIDIEQDISDLQSDLSNYLPLAGGTMSGTIVMNTNFIESLDGNSQLDFGADGGYIALTSDGQAYLQPYFYLTNENIFARKIGVLGYSDFKIGIGDNDFIDNFVWGNVVKLELNHNTLISLVSPITRFTGNLEFEATGTYSFSQTNGNDQINLGWDSASTLDIIVTNSATLGALSQIQMTPLKIDVTAKSSTITIGDLKGLVYAADYSATFVNESLVTKRYVDNSIPALTLAQTLTNDNKTGEQNIISDDGFSSVQIRNGYANLFYSDGANGEAAVVCNATKAELTYTNLDTGESGTHKIDSVESLNEHSEQIRERVVNGDLYGILTITEFLVSLSSADDATTSHTILLTKDLATISGDVVINLNAPLINLPQETASRFLTTDASKNIDTALSLTTSTTLAGNSDTNVPTEKAVKTYVDTQDAKLAKDKITITLDGSGGVISTGSKGYLTLPYAATITNWYVTGDQSGSVVLDVKRSGATIVGAGNKPTLSSTQRNNAAVSGWTSVAIAANDELEFNVDSATTVTRVNISIYITRTL